MCIFKSTCGCETVIYIFFSPTVILCYLYTYLQIYMVLIIDEVHIFNVFKCDGES